MAEPIRETPRIVTRARRVDQAGTREFAFTDSMVNFGEPGSPLYAYRQQAWEAFRSLPVPGTSEEAWRRTDLRGLKADAFHLPGKDAYLDLPAVNIVHRGSNTSNAPIALIATTKNSPKPKTL